jgi:hypothetical protein
MTTKTAQLRIEDKASMTAFIMDTLNKPILEHNKRLCSRNLWNEQVPLHGFDTWLKLAFMSDDEIRKLAKACGG